MSRTKNPVLGPKHLKALALIETGRLPLNKIAKEVGWGADHMYSLYEGDTRKGRAVAALFAAECRKIDKKQTDRIKELTKYNKAAAQELISTILDTLKKKKKLSFDDQKIVGTLTNCLAKSSPGVSINSVSYNQYTKGYTAEQLIHEFTRLQTLATGSSNRTAVSESFERGPGSLSPSAGPGDSMEGE